MTFTYLRAVSLRCTWPAIEICTHTDILTGTAGQLRMTEWEEHMRGEDTRREGNAVTAWIARIVAHGGRQFVRGVLPSRISKRNCLFFQVGYRYTHIPCLLAIWWDEGFSETVLLHLVSVDTIFVRFYIEIHAILYFSFFSFLHVMSFDWDLATPFQTDLK